MSGRFDKIRLNKKGESMYYLQVFLRGYWKTFISFYKIVGIVVLGAVAIYALSQSAGLSVLVCVAIGWYLHKNYDLKIKKRSKKVSKKKP
jgi:uncharacterized RDD family membrane protein YckC